jgi:hypothetical protein
LEARKIFLDEDAVNLIGHTLFETLTNDERMIINYIAEKGYMNVSSQGSCLQALRGADVP